jgi:hypothetical protein
MKLSSRSGLLILLLGAIALIAQLSPQNVQQIFSLFESDALGQSKHYTLVPEAIHEGDSLTVQQFQIPDYVHSKTLIPRSSQIMVKPETH